MNPLFVRIIYFYIFNYIGKTIKHVIIKVYNVKVAKNL